MMNNNNNNDNVTSGGRTRGDGMENVDTASIDTKTNPTSQSVLNEGVDEKLGIEGRASTTSIPGAISIYRPNDELGNTVKLPAKVPQGKLFYLVPHLISTNRTFTLKNKEPRFVPFEPYKAAVSKKLN